MISPPLPKRLYVLFVRRGFFPLSLWLDRRLRYVAMLMLPPPLPNQCSFKVDERRCGARGAAVGRSVSVASFNPFLPSFSARTALPLVHVGARWIAVGSRRGATGPNRRTALSSSSSSVRLSVARRAGDVMMMAPPLDPLTHFLQMKWILRPRAHVFSYLLLNGPL